MEINPQRVASATFRIVKRGFDPDEVRSFLGEVSSQLETTNQQATAMEARARAAVAKLHEVQQAVPAEPSVAALTHVDEAETISRTLLLAQRTADTTIAEAEAQAASMRARAVDDAARIEASARAEAAQTVAAARVEADRLLDEARVEAHRAKDEEHLRVENEVQALLARRDFLLADVDHLEQHVGAQRERVRDASVALAQIAERVPGGLAEMRRPLLSASAESSRPVPTDIRITGQVPIVGGEPLVSPRPTSVDEARTLWEQAEAAADTQTRTPSESDTTDRHLDRLDRLDRDDRWDDRPDAAGALDDDLGDDLDLTGEGPTPIAGLAMPYDGIADEPDAR
jgi:DivIVA domain-containing protein